MTAKPIAEDGMSSEKSKKSEFIGAVRQRLAELGNGERIPIEEIECELPT